MNINIEDAKRMLDEAMSRLPLEAQATLNVYRQKCIKIAEDKTLTIEEKTVKIRTLEAEYNKKIKDGNKAT